MRLLITGDWHYRAQPPISRLDDFQGTLNVKISEVFDIADRERCRAIIIPGDITGSPNLAYSTVTKLEQLIRGRGTGVYAIPGNHDEFAGNLESLDRTVYGHLAATGAINDRILQMSMSSPWNDVSIEGHGFSTDTDNDLSDYLVHKETSQVTVVVAHGMLLERHPGFEMKHSLLEDVARHPQCPDVLCVAHEHLGFGVRRLPRAKGGELVAINPGALIRLSAHPGEMERTVQVALLEIYNGESPYCPECGERILAKDVRSRSKWHLAEYQCPECRVVNTVEEADYGPPEIWGLKTRIIDVTLIPLASARPAHEVLSREHLEVQAARERQMEDFMALLTREGEAKFLDIQAIIEGIARRDKLPRDVVDEALRRIAAEREKAGSDSGGRGRAA